MVNPDTWVDQYGDILFRYALQRVKDTGVAEELVQETFLAAMRAKDRFRGQSTEQTWLFAIVKILTQRARLWLPLEGGRLPFCPQRRQG